MSEVFSVVYTSENEEKKTKNAARTYFGVW